jgi:hypothetical protein
MIVKDCVRVGLLVSCCLPVQGQAESQSAVSEAGVIDTRTHASCTRALPWLDARYRHEARVALAEEEVIDTVTPFGTVLWFR